MVFAIINGMKVKIDSAGRVVLPKNVRDRFRLKAGSRLELEESSEGILLKPAEQSPSMVLRDGVWVHLGTLPEGLDWNKLVDHDREERIKDIWGR